MAWRFGDLKPLRYGAILADCPWLYRSWSAAGERKNPIAHYDCLETDELKALPVHELAAPDCLLVMWATAPMLHRAIDVLTAWRFRYCTAGAWAKQSSTGRAWAFGTGYVLRSAAEFFLVGTIGKPRLGSKSVRNLIVAPVREHSRKPDAIYDAIERLTPDVARGELFARQSRPGWEAGGLEVDKFGTAA